MRVTMKKIFAVFAVASLFILLAWAQEEESSIGMDGQIPVGTFTCSDHIEMTALQDGRSDVRIVWAHGYYSALNGVDENSPPIEVAELVTFSHRLDKACQAEPDKLFLVAVREMIETVAP
jgi:hypothetical protein